MGIDRNHAWSILALVTLFSFCGLCLGTADGETTRSDDPSVELSFGPFMVPDLRMRPGINESFTIYLENENEFSDGYTISVQVSKDNWGVVLDTYTIPDVAARSKEEFHATVVPPKGAIDGETAAA